MIKIYTPCFAFRNWAVLISLLCLIACGERQTEVQLTIGVDISRLGEKFKFEFQSRLRAVEEHPEDVEPLGQLALLYQANGLLKDSVPILELLCEFDEETAKWPYLAHRVHVDLGAVDVAINYLDEALKRNPNLVLGYLRKADLLAKIGDAIRSKACYERCLELSPNHAYALLGLARLEIREGKWVAARDLLRKAIVSDRELATSYNLLSSVYKRMGEEELSRKSSQFGRAYSKHRDVDDQWLEGLLEHSYDTYALQVAASMYVDTLRPERALPVLERAFRLNPDDAYTNLELGKWYVKNGEKTVGYDYLDRAIKLNSDLDEAFYVKISELQLDKDFQAALAISLEAIQSFPEMSKFQRTAGVSWEKMGKSVAAKKHLLKAVELGADDTAALVALGNLYWKLGQKKRAVPYFERVRAISSAELDARVLLAGYYFEEERLEEMRSCIDEAYTLEPESDVLDELSANYFLRKGNEFLRSGELDSAESSYLDALQKMPYYVDCHVNLTSLYLKTGKLKEAHEHLRGVKHNAPELAFVYPLLAMVVLDQGDRVQAESLLKTGKSLLLEKRDRTSEKLMARVEHVLSRKKFEE